MILRNGHMSDQTRDSLKNVEFGSETLDGVGVSYTGPSVTLGRWWEMHSSAEWRQLLWRRYQRERNRWEHYQSAFLFGKLMACSCVPERPAAMTKQQQHGHYQRRETDTAPTVLWWLAFLFTSHPQVKHYLRSATVPFMDDNLWLWPQLFGSRCVLLAQEQVPTFRRHWHSTHLRTHTLTERGPVLHTSR